MSSPSLRSWVFVALLASTAARAQDLEVLAIVDVTTTPQGPVDEVDPPVAVSPGLVVFMADLGAGAATKESLIQVQGTGELEVLLSEPFTIAGEGIVLTDIRTAGGTEPSVDRPTGDILFNASWTPAGGGAVREGIFLRRKGSGNVASVVLDGDSVPDGNGQLGVAFSNHPALGGGDHVAFWAEIYNAVGGFGNGSGIFRSAGTGALTRIIRTGQVPPLGTSFFDGFSWPSVNTSGAVAFAGWLDSGPVGIYKGSGGELTEIALEGDEVVPGWEILHLDPVDGVPLNDSGNVAFRARIDDPILDVIALGSGGTLVRLAYGGQSPDSGQPGLLPYLFDENVALNNRDQVVFTGSYVNANDGIFRAENGHVVAIARRGGPVPGTATGTFLVIAGREFALNDAGDVAFKASFQVGGQTQTGLFLYTDRTGLIPIVQDGTPLGGSVVDEMTLVGTNPTEFRSREPTGLDASGRVAFRFGLASGPRGIAVFIPPALFTDGFESGDTDGWSAIVP